MNTHRFRLPLELATATLGLLALASSATSQEPVPTLQSGAVAPDFVSKDAAGREVHLSDYKGKVVILDYWATWCGYCIQSMPHVQELAKAQKAAGVVVLAVCTSDTRAKYDEWVKKNQEQYPDLVFTCEPYDRGSDQFDERASNKLYHVSGLPTKFVVDRTGKVALTIVGYEKDDMQLEAGLARAGIQIDAAVAQKGEAQAKKDAAEAAERAANAAANPPPTFHPEFGAVKSGDPCPDFTMTGPDGKECKLSSLRGKPTVIAFAWSEIVPKKQLQEMQTKYASYGVQTLALMVFTARAEYDEWVAANKSQIAFQTAHDPVGKYVAAGDKPDPQAQMAHAAKTIVAQFFTGNMLPGMPILIVVDAEGRFVGSFGLGPKWNDGLANLLLHAGVKLKPEDLPKVVAPAEAFVVKPPPPPEAKVEPIQIGAAAPDFTTQDLAGKDVKLADYHGKIIVLDFWATWCGPCQAALPHTQSVAAKYKDQDVVVLAACTSDARAKFVAWVKEHQGDYPDIVFSHDAAERTPERASRRLYGVTGIPMQFVIGRDGKIASTVIGYTEGEVLLDAALAKAGVKVDEATLTKAAADQKKRDERKRESTPALPLMKPKQP